jgi:hypothetical protein
LLRQLLRDGHGGRPNQFTWSDISLMRCFPWERPSNNRWLQVMYTATRMWFDACQMAKLFPSLAWHEMSSKWQYAANKYKQ